MQLAQVYHRVQLPSPYCGVYSNPSLPTLTIPFFALKSQNNKLP